MAQCPKCGKQVNDSATFCTDCGQQITPTQQQPQTPTQQNTQMQQPPQQPAQPQQPQQPAQPQQQNPQQNGNQGYYVPPADQQQYAPPQQQPQYTPQPNNAPEIFNTPDSTTQFHPQDIEQNKIISLFSYLGILWLITYFGAANSPYARYHAKQGLPLMIIGLAWGFISAFIGFFLRGIPVVGFLLNLVLTAGHIIILVLTIIGIINAVTGKAKELPIIGKWKINI